MRSITFKINLKNQIKGTLLTPAEEDVFASTHHSWLSTGGIAGLPAIYGKHGDTFTLHGQQAAYLKRMIEQQRIFDIELYIPPQESPEPEELSENTLYLVEQKDDSRPTHGIYAAYEGSFYLGGNVGKFNNDHIRIRGVGIHVIGNYVYRLYGKTTAFGNNRESLVFDRIDLSSQNPEPEILHEDIDDLNSDSVKELSYHDGLFYATIANHLYSFNPSTFEFDQLSFNSNYTNFAFHDGDMFTINNGDIIQVDTETGQTLPNSEVQITIDVYSVEYSTSMCFHQGDLYAVLGLYDENDNHDRYICEINPTTGVGSIIQRVGNVSALSVYDNRFVIQMGTRDEPIDFGVGSEELQNSGLYVYSVDLSEITEIHVDSIKRLRSSAGVAKNPENGMLYSATTERFEDPEDDYTIYKLKLNQYNPITKETTEIPFSNYYNTVVRLRRKDFIQDGNNDMYDVGNVLNTDLFPGISYTHTQQEEFLWDGESFDIEDFPMDGEIKDGSKWFGEGSTYFTNFYPGFFIMAAHNISIDHFFTTGNNGADGDGNVSASHSTITNNGQLYSTFRKSIWNAGDPAIHQMIIVRGDGENIKHIINEDTNSGYQCISNLQGIDRIYYVVVSTYDFIGEEGTMPHSSQLNAITARISNILFDGENDPDSLEDFLATLNQDHANVIDNIDNLYLFTDSAISDSGGDSIYYSGGFNEVHALAYVGNNELILAGDQRNNKGIIMKVNIEDGTIKPLHTSLAINNDWEHELTDMEYHNGVLYGVTGETTIAIIDPETGVITNEFFKKFEDAVSFTDGEARPWSIHSFEGKLYTLFHDDDSNRYIGILNPDTFVISNESEIRIQDRYRLSSGPKPNDISLGRANENFYEFNGWYWDDEGANNWILYFDKRIESIIPITTQNIQIEWCFRNELNRLDQNSSPWSPVGQINAVQYEGNDVEIFFHQQFEEEAVLRIKYKDDNSGKWVFAEYD